MGINKTYVKELSVILFMFLLGVGFANGIQYIHISEENPLSLTLIGSPTPPSSTLNSNDIEIHPEKIIINIPGASISRYAATGSMLPVLNEASKGIKIPVTDPEQLHIGDIVTYENTKGDLIIHRIVSIGLDENGTFYLTKGDNNLAIDAKVRYEQIKYKLIALVY